MKKLSYLVCALFLVSCFIVSCTKQEAPEPTITSKIVTKSMLPFIMDGDKNNSKGNARISGVNAYTEYGPFTLTLTGTKISGPNGGYWMNTIFHFPGLYDGQYLCDVYRYSATIPLPLGAYLIFDGATNTGWEGNANPVDYNTVRAFNESKNSTTNTYYLNTYTVAPRYNLSGQNVNPNQTKYPFNSTTTTITYRYFTL